MYLSQVPLSALSSTTEPTFEEWLDFAASASSTGKRKCVKPTAFPCGNTCLASHTKTGKPVRCNKMLEGQARSHAGWLKKQAQANEEAAKKETINIKSSKKSTKATEKKKTELNYAVDLSDHVALTKLGEDFSRQHLNFIGSGTKEEKLLEEKKELFKQYLETTKKGDKEAALSLESEMLKKETEYTLEKAKNQLAANKQFKSIHQAIIEKHGLSNNQIEELTKKVDIKTDATDSALTKAEATQLRLNLNQFCSLTGGRGFDSLKRIEAGTDRAYSNPNGIIDLDRPIDRTVLLHELGHHVEYESTSLRDSANGWRESKASSLSPMSLNKITKSDSYRSSETALPGDFVHPYVGKIYKNKSTEVVSVGLEHFSSPNKMRQLYEKDKSHFNYIVGILIGENRTKT